MDYSKKTLGELLSSANDTIKRHATGILKMLQNKIYCRACTNEMKKDDFSCRECGYDQGN